MSKAPDPVNHNLYPLSADEQEHLYIIYRTRKKYFILPYLFIISYALYTCLRPIEKDGYYTIPDTGTDAFISTALLLSLLLVPLILAGFRIYSKKILCYKKDAEAGMKERLTKTIVRKSYFPLTGQYFISFDDPNYMHHEVDADFYNSCYEGGEAYLYRAPLSNYTFNKNGVFSLL